MSEFLHLDSVKLFMGDETGSPGRLGNVLSRHQRGVLLFDEIEKAHRLIWDLLLQMLDAARITLADHRAYDLSGFYIVCTSNIGAQQLLRPTRLPFTTLERAVISELHRFFRPELIGRFDEKIVFRPLSPETQREIARLAIAEELARFRERDSISGFPTRRLVFGPAGHSQGARRAPDERDGTKVCRRRGPRRDKGGRAIIRRACCFAP